MRQSTTRASRRRLALAMLLGMAMLGTGAFPAEAAGRRLTSKLWKKE